MATEELELRQKIAEAKAEEKTYEQFGKNLSCDQDYLGIQRKQAELSEMIVTQQARSLLLSH